MCIITKPLTTLPLRILLVAATAAEIEPLRTAWKLPNNAVHHARLQLDFLITGVGAVATAVVLTEHLLEQRYELILNVGICGSFRQDWPLGQVLRVWAGTPSPI